MIVSGGYEDEVTGGGNWESWKMVVGSLKLKLEEFWEEYFSTCTWKVKLDSSKITFPEIKSLLEVKSKQRYPL